MTKTLLDTITLAQQKLGDESGELFTSALLLPHVLSAFRDLGRLMKNLQIPQSRRVRFAQISPNQSALTFDFTSFTTPDYASTIEIGDRPETLSYVIGVIAGSGTDTITITTTVPHTLTAGQVVMVIGTKWRWLDGAHSVYQTPTSSSFTIRGVLATGSDNVGLVSVGGGGFQPVQIVSQIDDYPTTPLGWIEVAAINENTLRFPPCSTSRQLRISYNASADDLSSTSDLIGFDDAIDFLAVVGGGYAASAKGAQGKAEMLEEMAFGPQGPGGRDRTNPSGGLARALLADAVKAMQHQQWARPPFRPRRVPIGYPYPFF